MSTKSRTILLKLSECCQRHRSHHHEKKVQYLHTDWDEIPAYCQSSITSLQQLLPKVELAADDDDIHHLCEFYIDTIQGGFCPYAPHLFELGRDSKLVFSRVRSLLQHSTKCKQQFPSVGTLQILSKAMAHFLNLLDDSKLREKCIHELIELLLDLCSLQDGISFTDNNLQIILFASHGEEYIVTVNSCDAIALLHFTLLTCLRHFFELENQQMLSQPEFPCERAQAPGTTIWQDVPKLHSLFAIIQESFTSSRTNHSHLQRTMRHESAQLLKLCLESWHRESAPSLPCLLQIATLVSQAPKNKLEPLLLDMAILMPPRVRALGYKTDCVHRMVLPEVLERVENRPNSATLRCLLRIHSTTGMSLRLSTNIFDLLQDGRLSDVASYFLALEMERVLGHWSLDSLCRMVLDNTDIVEQSQEPNLLLGKRKLNTLESESSKRRRSQNGELVFGVEPHCSDMMNSDSRMADEFVTFMADAKFSSDLVVVCNAIQLLCLLCRNGEKWKLSEAGPSKALLNLLCCALSRITDTVSIDSGARDGQVPTLVNFFVFLNVVKCDFMVAKNLIVKLEPTATAFMRVSLDPSSDTVVWDAACEAMLGHCLFQQRRQVQLRSSIHSIRDCFLLTIFEEGRVTNVQSILPSIFPIDCHLEIQYRRLRLWNLRKHKEDDLPDLDESIREVSLGVVESCLREEKDASLRLSQWQIAAWFFLHGPPAETRLILDRFGENNTKNILHFILKTPFSDADPCVRDYSSREVAKLFSSELWLNLLSMSLHTSLWNDCRTKDHSVESSHGALSSLCSLIDQFINVQRNIPQSQLKVPVSTSTSPRGTGEIETKDGDQVSHDSFRRSAIRTLTSIGTQVDCASKKGGQLFQDAIVRVVRIFMGAEGEDRCEKKGFCIGELFRVEFGDFVSRDCHERFWPALFREILTPGSSSAADSADAAVDPILFSTNDRKYNFLSLFVRRFCLPPSHWSTPCPLPGFAEIEKCLESVLPFVVARLVVETDYRTLRLTTGYKLHLLVQGRTEAKTVKRALAPTVAPDHDLLLATSKFIELVSQSKRVKSFDLDQQTKHLCLAPAFIEQILPLILMHSSQNELHFFTQQVLQNTMTLHDIVANREQLILKGLVWELGRNLENVERAKRALTTAAVAKNHQPKQPKSGDESSDAVEMSKVYVVDWISSQFMYLLVNVVQYRWRFRTDMQRRQALRCLRLMLEFLRPSDASQYFPQILATVNVALGEAEAPHAQSEDPDGLRILSVEILSEFSRIVADSQLETLGRNLAAVVVALIPSIIGNTPCHAEKVTQESAVATELLEWMTSGSIGNQLAPYFAEIPFLPMHPSLDTVRTSLKGLGVDFDNLHTIPATQGTQRDGGGTYSVTGSSDMGASSADSGAALCSPRRQDALRRRLRTISAWLNNDNASIRCAALEHLTGIIKANRELFHSLVDDERGSSMARCVTVPYESLSAFKTATITGLVSALLDRCVQESDFKAKALLGTCLGELGAIDEQRLDENRQWTFIDSENDPNSFSWRLSKPPWQSRPERYELQLVTSHLVAALKSAPTSNDQHKVAFTIQQMLVLLDSSVCESQIPQRNPSEDGAGERRPMSKWLISKLDEAQVYDVVEPFWSSEFHEAETFASKEPPFFRSAVSYYNWISYWCRYMVWRCNGVRRSKWNQLFYACRTCLRTPAGLEVAEFLIPLLVLDRLCFGDAQDERVVLSEIRDALDFRDDCEFVSKMNLVERHKAVSVLFTVIDTLQLWMEREVERKHKNTRGKSGRTGQPSTSESNEHNDEWPLDDSILRIEDLLQAIPLSNRAKAAAAVGMQARALRLLEFSARSSVAQDVFDGDSSAGLKRSRSRSAGACDNADLEDMKDVLASLNDFETMVALMEDESSYDTLTRIRDSIRVKEASGDWSGALQDYERAQQLIGGSAKSMQFSHRGSLQCLLELGQLATILNLVETSEGSSRMRVGPSDEVWDMSFAIEASWRLGRWEKLQELLDSKPLAQSDPQIAFHTSFGKAMLHLFQRSAGLVSDAVNRARCATMDSMCSAARESYQRAYVYMVRLHAIREIEDAAALICGDSTPNLGDSSSDWGWDSRLEFLSAPASRPIINCRLALSRIAKDKTYESLLFLHVGKRARKDGLTDIATNALCQAEAAMRSLAPTCKAWDLHAALRLQFAKLKHDGGDTRGALRLLGGDDIENITALDNDSLRCDAARQVEKLLGFPSHGMNEDAVTNLFVKSTLLSSKWMMEGSLKSVAEMMVRFQTIHRVAPKWEKGHVEFAKYIDSILESRIVALQRKLKDSATGEVEDLRREYIITSDRTCQKYILDAISHYMEALSLDLKHVYQALPRLLSLWFDFTSVRRPPDSCNSAKGLADAHEEVNTFMAKHFRRIPAQAFYTAMAQLISRVIHDDKETSLVVREILKRVLVKFPAQAMWALAWVRQSRHAERCKVGDSIFREAERVLAKSSSDHLHKLLVASRSLFSFFQELAKYTVKDMTLSSIKVKSWKGEVDLTEFVPPIQSALETSMMTGNSDRPREPFPRNVPRIRVFDSEVSLMASKARPKKLKAYVVTAETAAYLRSQHSSTGILLSKRSKHDVGELHFLVKQEAKGDLRKDARVQDLNNVINRLMATASQSNVAAQHRRRLHLRTFAVTCLSEDTGLLEWVPYTESLRNLVARAYNPQASEFSPRRRGRRIANFSDPSLRNNFEGKCQTMFFTNGDLKRAATLFEQLCLKPYPPLLYWWFVQAFHDPHSWYEARMQFTLSAAAWSAVGHVIGLGDRHSENILVDTTSGASVHVDFDCIFDKGLNLPKPEVVPFRLTQNMVDAFGPTGADGIYSSSLKNAMSTLRINQETLLSVLEPFVKDPVIDWKRYRSQQKGDKTASTQERQAKEAKRSINVIQERLTGIYNLRNPNLRKIRRTDVQHGEDDDELAHLLPLSVEGQVHKMIAEATSNDNLVQLYVGWMPWL